jgi:hypothetical protein
MKIWPVFVCIFGGERGEQFTVHDQRLLFSNSYLISIAILATSVLLDNGSEATPGQALQLDRASGLLANEERWCVSE